MRTNETGEFELVVGNKQLLSGFFIVVLLFAVAFAMGYVVGQNTQRPAHMASEGSAMATNVGPDARPQPSTPMQQPPPAAPAPEPKGGEIPPGEGPAPGPTTQPAQGSAPTSGEKAVDSASTGIMAASELPAGSYWQVIAVKPEVAEAMRRTLRDKGFQVSLTPATSSLTRVLVGPYMDNPSLGRAKTELETAGFQPVRFKRD
ncbi:MAG: SPOR domain-containing protein [Candidatus Solibacter sp.]